VPASRLVRMEPRMPGGRVVPERSLGRRGQNEGSAGLGAAGLLEGGSAGPASGRPALARDGSTNTPGVLRGWVVPPPQRQACARREGRPLNTSSRRALPRAQCWMQRPATSNWGAGPGLSKGELAAQANRGPPPGLPSDAGGGRGAMLESTRQARKQRVNQRAGACASRHGGGHGNIRVGEKELGLQASQWNGRYKDSIAPGRDRGRRGGYGEDNPLSVLDQRGS
jgi:hypothetical protein